VTEQLTPLQSAILRIDRLGLPLRDAVRLANVEAGFFVGQSRYLDELRKARRLIAEPADGRPEPQPS
jgi:hypothetical protein